MHSIFGRFLRPILFFVIFVSVPPAAFAAPNLPRLDDPQLQEFLNILKSEYEQYLSSGSPHLVRPSEIKPWPCELTPVQLNKLAGTTDSDDDPITKRDFINSARASRSQPISVVYSGQKFYPVQATCKAGKLEGPVDFWVEYDFTTIAAPMFSQIRHMLSHVRFTATGGNPNSLVLKVNELLSLDTKYNNPATAEMMSKQKKHNTLSVSFSADWMSEPPVPYAPSVSLTHVDLDSNGKVILTTRTVRPFGGNRHEITQYGFFGVDSTHKDSTTLY